jgi:hypothetical protein
MTVALDELDRDFVVPLGDVGRELTIATAGATPRTMELDFEDPAPMRGTNAYWIKVVQNDGEMAWTSPVFVTVLRG